MLTRRTAYLGREGVLGIFWNGYALGKYYLKMPVIIYRSQIV